jgi:hypothetical protein
MDKILKLLSPLLSKQDKNTEQCDTQALGEIQSYRLYIETVPRQHG